jgi:hypothetical protein
VKTDIDSLLQVIVDLEGQEGVVVRFSDGHMTKIKSSIYVNIHRAKDNLLYERHVIEMILNETVDDVKAFLPDIDKQNLDQYQDNISKWIDSTVERLYLLCYKPMIEEKYSRKQFAINVSAQAKPFDSFLFKNYEQIQEADPSIYHEFLVEGVEQALLKACSSNSSLTTFKSIANIHFNWSL